MEDQAHYFTKSDLQSCMKLTYSRFRNTSEEVDPSRYDDRCGDFIETAKQELTGLEPSEEEFEATIAMCFGVSIEQMHRYKWRKREVVMARQLMMLVYRYYYKLSLAAAGWPYKKDHATVLHSIKTSINLYETDKHYRKITTPVWALWRQTNIELPEFLKLII